RVDLDGQPCGELEQEHIEHAQATLKESQEKAKAKRAAKAPTAPKAAPKRAAKKVAIPSRAKSERPAKPVAKPAAPVVNLVQAQLADLAKKQRVNVKLGATPVAGVITDINKEDIHVQLDSGLTIKVRAEHILL
ncbi:MAG: ProQ/FINO family protein, partial [Shewanella sp.]